MKFCILMSSPRENGNTAELCKPFIAQLKTSGAEVSYVTLADKNILPCLGCYVCQDVQGEYGCVQNDDVPAVLEQMLSADCVVFATPIYTWYCTAPMKALLDRHYGLNKFYGSATGSLWEGKNPAHNHPRLRRRLWRRPLRNGHPPSVRALKPSLQRHVLRPSF